MKFFVILSLVSVATITVAKSTSKKSSSTSDETGSNQKSAIIAIQIVDPEDEKTGGKLSKRTIDNALGYGFQGNRPQPPRYEVYKYSQNDIPAFQGSHFKSGGHKKNSGASSGLSKHYLPGTTLFSSIGQNGQIANLSPNLPSSLHSQSIPVIILKVFPSQLTSNHLYPSLPSSNNFASVVNSIDIKSLLDSYVPSTKGGTLGRLPAPSYQYVTPTTKQVSQIDITTPKYQAPAPVKPIEEYQSSDEPQYQPQQAFYQPQLEQQQVVQYQSPQVQYQPQQVQYENQQLQYEPQQVQYEPQQLQYEPQQVQYVPQQVQYESQQVQYEPLHYQSQTQEYEPQYQTSQLPDRPPRVQYQAQQVQYQPEQYQRYQSPKEETSFDVVKSKEYELPSRIYHYPAKSNINQEPQSQGLLTYENYPSDTHTRVIFKTDKGGLRSSQKQESNNAAAYASTPNLAYEKYPVEGEDYSEQEVGGNRYEQQYENNQEEDNAEKHNVIYIKNRLHS